MLVAAVIAVHVAIALFDLLYASATDGAFELLCVPCNVQDC